MVIVRRLPGDMKHLREASSYRPAPQLDPPCLRFIICGLPTDAPDCANDDRGNVGAGNTGINNIGNNNSGDVSVYKIPGRLHSFCVNGARGGHA